MSYRKLVIGLSVVGLMIPAGSALAQQSKKPTAVIRAAPVASAPAPIAPTPAPMDAFDPIEFKPAPMDAFEAVGGPQVVYPQATFPSPAYVPHVGMATRVTAVEENCMPPSLPALPQGHFVPPPTGQFPSAAAARYPMPAIGPYASSGYAYPAPPAFNDSAPPCPHYIVSPRPLTKSELLRGALCHLEAAGAEELVNLVRIEVVTEEKRELTEELARKDAELQALKSDVDRLRAQVDEPKDESADEPKGESKPACPQVKVKVQVLELDLAKIKAAGIELPPCACPNQACAEKQDTSAQPNGKPRDLAEWMTGKATKETAVAPASSICLVDSQDSLDKFFQVLSEAKAMSIVAEPCLVVQSGKRARFCCAGGAKTHIHSEVETCDYCAADGIEVDLLATTIEDKQIQTEVKVRHRKATVLPANTTGIEGAIPPSMQITELNTVFASNSGQTFVSTLRRQVRCTDDYDTSEAKSDEPADEIDGAKPKCKEVICMILVTTSLVDEMECSDAPSKCSCECPCEKCSAAKCSSSECSSSQCPPAVFETTTADGIRLRMMREPFLKDVQLEQEVELGDLVLGGVRPRIFEEYCAKCQRASGEAARQQNRHEPGTIGNEQLLKANFHYYRPGDKSTDLTPHHWGLYPPERPFIISGIELRR